MVDLAGLFSAETEPDEVDRGAHAEQAAGQ